MTVIGRGGLAKVCKVKHKQLDRIYAMKIIKIPVLIQRKQAPIFSLWQPQPQPQTLPQHQALFF